MTTTPELPLALPLRIDLRTFPAATCTPLDISDPQNFQRVYAALHAALQTRFVHAHPWGTLLPAFQLTTITVPTHTGFEVTLPDHWRPRLERALAPALTGTFAFSLTYEDL